MPTIFKTNKLNYLLGGILFGCLFPFISYFFLDNPDHLFLVILTAPIVLGFFAFLIGKREDNLKDEVRKRTEDLRVSNQGFENALKVKSRFLATMSHEIRTPLNAVLSCVTLLKTNVEKPENIVLLDTISESGKILLTLINDVLDLSKIEAGKLKIESKPFNILESTENIYNLYKGNIRGIKTDLRIENIAEIPQYVIGDSIRYKQVLSNLIDNAIKFSKDNVLITLTVEKKESDFHNIVVTVKDNGIGISKNALSKLFSDFEQGDRATTRLYGGTGLGLSICQRLVRLMGGDIQVSSQLDHGSQFTFNVIVRKTNIILAKNEKNLSYIDQSLAIKYPLNILVVEDNRINQMVIEKLLNKLGYKVDVVENGKVAIDAVNEGNYDLVLMDMNMPVMGGIEATKIIKAIHGNSITICALTANAFSEDKEKCLAAGMDGFLVKPIKLEDLTGTIINLSKEKYHKKIV